MRLKRDEIGQLLFIGFDGQTLDQALEARLLKLRPGGIILFRRNISSAEQCVDLCERLHNLYDPPPMIGIDQEGGKVHRLSTILPDIPDASTLGNSGNEMNVEEIAAAIGKALRALGMDIDFAPVCDLSLPGDMNGIGDRAFGNVPEIVITMGAAFLRGLLSEGVAGTLKHFPGLGASSIDSHTSLPTISKGKISLGMEDMKPFAVLSEIAPLIMVGHGYYPSLTTEKLPATLSSEIVTVILRKEMEFKGVVITDDMEMGAMSDCRSEGEEAVRALHAGCDMVMYASSLEMAENAYEKIVLAIEDERLREKEIGASLRRIAEIRGDFVVTERLKNSAMLLQEASKQIVQYSDEIT